MILHDTDVTEENARRDLQTTFDFQLRETASRIEQRMAAYELKVVEFSVLSLLAHNPGLTSRHVCATLSIMPPNLVGLVASLEKRGLLERRPHPSDGRAMGLHLTPAGLALAQETEQAVAQLEMDATAKLSASERKTLIRLLQKVYD